DAGGRVSACRRLRISIRDEHRSSLGAAASPKGRFGPSKEAGTISFAPVISISRAGRRAPFRRSGGTTLRKARKQGACCGEVGAPGRDLRAARGAPCPYCPPRNGIGSTGALPCRT